MRNLLRSSLFFFFISLPSSKLTISLISIYKCYTINIADPSSMQDVCHMNFVIDLAHCGVSVVAHQSMESKGLRFESSWGDSEFFLCSMLVTRQITSLFLYQAENFPSLLFLSTRTTLVGDHFLYSCDPHVWFRGDIVRRTKMLVTLRGPRIYMSTHFILHVRSPSPEPIYNTEGKRLNTREFRVRKKLEEERHVLIQEALSLNEDYKPPADYK